MTDDANMLAGAVIKNGARLIFTNSPMATLSHQSWMAEDLGWLVRVVGEFGPTPVGHGG